MTKSLERAFEEATRLPEPEQNALAQRILADIASERRWNDTFGASTDALAQLADEALAEHRAGKTRLLEPDRM